MVKKLRNREIANDDDLETQPQQECLLTKHEIKLNALRKIIGKKNLQKSLINEQKHKRFKNHLTSGELAQIISETSFQCSICLEMMVEPTMMLCGHMYCLKCLESTNVYNQRCSLCRKEQENQPFVPNQIVERIIHQFLLPASHSFLAYLCRMTDTEQWSKRRKLNSLRPCLVIDFQDRFSTWRKGVVASIFTSEGRMMAKIKVNIKGDDFFEIVQTNSRRIAPFTFFTRRRYLDDFAPSLPELDLVDKQLAQLQYKISNIKSNTDFWNHEVEEEKNEIEEFIQVSHLPEGQCVDEIIMALNQEIDLLPHLLF